MNTVATTIGGCYGGPLVMGLDPGIASVTSVTRSTRTGNTSTVSVVGALANVHVSVGSHEPVVHGGANKVDNPTVFPITMEVI